MNHCRPARLQVDPDSIDADDKPFQTGHTFNIWYLKWAGGDSSLRNSVKSRFRVNIKRDSGYTKGVDGESPLCIFFARGCCYRGKKCPFLHRLPKLDDHWIPTQDCFGRDKTAEYRDDMGGVGSLSRVNRTLYVAGAHMNDQTQENLNTQFSEFGDIDKIRVLHSRNCAFVSFRLESSAQFAKEAMDSQTLDGNDVITVKWANDDPDPKAQQNLKRQMEESAMETVTKLLGSNESSRKKPKSESASSSLTPIGKVSSRPDESLDKVSTPPSFAGEETAESRRGSFDNSSTGILDKSRLDALRQFKSLKYISVSSPKKDTTVVGLKPFSGPSDNGPLSSKASSTSLLSGYVSDEDTDESV